MRNIIHLGSIQPLRRFNGCLFSGEDVPELDVSLNTDNYPTQEFSVARPMYQKGPVPTIKLVGE
ncbi:MAG: hypothetical protein V3T58_01710 [Candidatus Hydrothermarchaeales archaeon]